MNGTKNISCTSCKPAEFGKFLKIGADLTISVLSHICGSRSREITSCARRATALPHALTYWALDKLGLSDKMKKYRRKRWKSVDSTHIFIQFASDHQCCTDDISVVPQDISVKATHRDSESLVCRYGNTCGTLTGRGTSIYDCDGRRGVNSRVSLNHDWLYDITRFCIQHDNCKDKYIDHSLKSMVSTPL